MEIIAHRGASYDAPENTLAAVKEAWQQQADAVEIDIRLSRDRRLVVIHDETTQRTGGLNKAVHDQSWAELQTLDVGSWKGSRWRDEKISTLDRVLKSLPVDKRLFLEIKAGPELIVPLQTALDQAGCPPVQIAIIGFDYPTLKQLKDALPRNPVYWVCRFKRGWFSRRWTPAIDEWIRPASEAGFAGLDLNLQGPIDLDTVGRTQAAGLQVYVWTVDSPTAARRLVEAGVDGITTNRPGWMRQQLNSIELP